jgi:hypothetical protein
MTKGSPSLPRPDRAAGLVTRLLAAMIDFVVVLVMMVVLLLTVAGWRFLRSPVSFRWPLPSWPLSLLVGCGCREPCHGL